MAGSKGGTRSILSRRGVLESLIRGLRRLVVLGCPGRRSRRRCVRTRIQGPRFDQRPRHQSRFRPRCRRGGRRGGGVADVIILIRRRRDRHAGRYPRVDTTLIPFWASQRGANCVNGETVGCQEARCACTVINLLLVLQEQREAIRID